ncbi:streptophobe family protein [Streptomyces indicus]|uniref:Integral membrane protein n=1 Tax=Streptomyces indicus TaxID=417292 RepID=A0A1G9JVH1_9ACTN|nr:streptophobe family protein [Streptomyces indicus]SDL41539.1 hypothetical protein SAMN05421806_1378 [Streptomyces indicus]
MGAMRSAATVGGPRRIRWGDVLLTAVACVSWSLVGMAGVAALGLHLLGADAAGSLGPMTAAAVVLGAGGSVTPSGDVSAFGLEGAEATTAIEVTPLGVSLAGALLLAFFFLRSLRALGVEISPGELAARAGAVAALFLAMLAGLAWAGHDVITLDGASLGLDQLPDGGGLTDDLPGGIGELLPDRLGDLVEAEAAVGFTVDTGPSLLGGLVWVLGVLVVALLFSRRTPLPAALAFLDRVARPAFSALVTVLLVAVAAGLAAAAYAAIGDDHPGRIAGAALLGAPNGVWLAVPLGLFVPWDGKATGALAEVLPAPLDAFFRASADEPATVGRLAELDGRVWLLVVAVAVMMLFAGVLAAARTPVGPLSAAGFAGRCAVRLGGVGAVVVPLLVWLTAVSANASLSVLGFDAFGASLSLQGQAGMGLLLGAVWGLGAGGLGALLAYGAGAAGGRVVGGASGAGGGAASGPGAGPLSGDEVGPYDPAPPFRPANPQTNPYLRLPDEVRESSRDGSSPPDEWPQGGGGRKR